MGLCLSHTGLDGQHTKSHADGHGSSSEGSTRKAQMLTSTLIFEGTFLFSYKVAKEVIPKVINVGPQLGKAHV